ncbi:MAG: flagellar hook basal-body protein [Phycisphaeraceae bacterium]
MNYGLYLSASGMLTNMHRQDVTSNNLANVETAGFKRDLVSLLQRQPESAASGQFDLSNQMMDRLGGSTWVGASRPDLSPGPLKETNAPLDLAMQGEGFFVVAEQRNGEVAERLTRDGRLKINANGNLATSVGELPLMDAQGEPIALDPTLGVEVNEYGVVSQGGAEVGQLRLVHVEDPLSLTPRGQGLYAIDPDQLDNAQPAPGLVRQGFIEQSNVDPVKEMLAMIESSRAINHHGTMLQYHDQLMDRAVNVLGRVA